MSGIRKVYESILSKQLFYSLFEYVKSSEIYKISRSSYLERVGCRLENMQYITIFLKQTLELIFEKYNQET